MKKKVVSLLLAVAMLSTSVLTGCGSKTSSTGATNNSDKKIEITYTGYWSDDTYKDESYVENLLEEALNIELEIVTFRTLVSILV